MKIYKDYPLADLTTFKVGGKAKYFTKVRKQKDLFLALNFAKENNLAIFILGNGSNILISDSGFNGLVIKNEIKFLKFKSLKNKIILEIGSGMDWDKVVLVSCKNDFTGIECLSGIPGTVGAAPISNIGAYGQELSEVFIKAKALDLQTYKIKIFSKKDCDFSYRTSFFKNNPYKYFIISLTLSLNKNKKPVLNYLDLQRFFQNKNNYNLKDVRRAVLRIRKNKGMTLSAGLKSAGSFFTNPIISKNEFSNLKSKIKTEKTNWFWPNDNKVKVSAAFLIEQAGFNRGYQKGQAAISPYHSLCLINLNKAKAQEIVDLAFEIQKKVFQKFKVKIKPEVELIGFEKYPLLF